MIRIFVPLREPEKIARLLSLASASVKEAKWLDGIQWKVGRRVFTILCYKVALTFFSLTKGIFGVKTLVMKIMG